MQNKFPCYLTNGFRIFQSQIANWFGSFQSHNVIINRFGNFRTLPIRSVANGFRNFQSQMTNMFGNIQAIIITLCYSQQVWIFPNPSISSVAIVFQPLCPEMSKAKQPTGLKISKTLSCNCSQVEGLEKYHNSQYFST